MDKQKEAKGKTIYKANKIAKARKNKLLTGFLLTFIVGYFLFFTSNIWFPAEQTYVVPTKVDVSRTWQNREISLVSWQYSETQRMMEIQIDVNNKALDGINTYTFSALDRKQGYLTVDKIVEEDNFIVVRIKNVKPNWSEIVLRMNMAKKSNASSSASSQSLSFFTNKNDINKVAKIEDNTLNGYMTIRLENVITRYENLITELNKKIEDANTEIQTSNDEIAKLKEKEKYQTQKEITETEGLINSAQNNIQSYTKTIDESNNSIQEYTQRINLAKEQMQEYQ